jgi:hypothetical protein
MTVTVIKKDQEAGLHGIGIGYRGTDRQPGCMRGLRNLNLTDHIGPRHHGPRSLHGYINAPARIAFVRRDKHKNDQLNNGGESEETGLHPA